MFTITAMNEENLSLLKLFLSDDLGPVRCFRLLSVFKSAKAVLAAKKSDLTAVEGISEKTADNIKNALESDKAEKELELAAANKVDILLFNDDRYPDSLRDFGDRPPVLYVKGTLKERDAASISIVGSRQATNYGKSVTAEFAGWFAQRGITIVSGLARGVDTEAHVTALKEKGRTIAVLGNGVLVTYPPENTVLQTKIPESGALVSEFPLLRQPDKTTFPRRNRIIAMLSKATLVTEASQSSGALITAKMCAEYGKDVFAVPGSIYSIFSKGANSLIKQGA
ncbi:MAG: DNA-processing protein DprA, partial [Endomicrobia bacterium]|nr:DNA-processing protein DprA [Endomicrobiia bacterium]